MLLALATMPLLAQFPADESKEKALAAEFRRQSKPLDNPAAREYARRIGARLDAACTFDVVIDGTEPVSLPGCTILIPVKFFASAADEAEFASMLAHAVAHSRLRHGIRRANGDRASIPIVYVDGCHVDCGSSAAFGPSTLAERRRAEELEADQEGLGIATRAGYPGAAYRQYVERRQGADGGNAMLPRRQERLRAIDEALRLLPAVSYSPNGEFAQVAALVNPPVQRRVPTLRR